MGNARQAGFEQKVVAVLLKGSYSCVVWRRSPGAIKLPVPVPRVCVAPSS